jgi:formylglycine-generating enzyme required for sulfatase activity
MKKYLFAILFASALKVYALPPQVEADRLMIEAKTFMDAKDYAAAVDRFGKVEELKARKPDTFAYHYGVALAGMGQWASARQKLDQYLTASGSNGKFYREALEKYNEVDKKLKQQQAEADRSAEQQKAEQERTRKQAEVERGKLEMSRQLVEMGFVPGKLIQDCAGCPEMIVVPGGSFDMGGDVDDDHKPAHRVSLKTFALGKTEVTNGQWRVVMGSFPSVPEYSTFCRNNDACPVTGANWDDANTFIQRLNAMTGKQYRLPSESEWEYACRAGGRHKYCGSDDFNVVAWVSNNRGRDVGGPFPVARKQANAFGLYDMSGNVQEWVEDYYHYGYIGGPSDGSAWLSLAQKDRMWGGRRVMRGGETGLNDKAATSAARGSDSSSKRIGFRVARELP